MISVLPELPQLEPENEQPVSAASTITILMNQFCSSALARVSSRSVSPAVPGNVRIRFSPRKSVIALKDLRSAGSLAGSMWLRDSSGTNLAPGIPAAISWPTVKGMRMSPRECMTSVGVVTFARRSATLNSQWARK